MWPFRRRTDDDFHHEIEAHIALEIDRLIAEGVIPDEARSAARRRFGNVTTAHERFSDARRFVSLDDAWRDLQYGCRTLMKHPRFSVAAVLTLGLGIGGSIAMFAAIDTLFVRELPYRDADRIALVWQTPPDNRSDRVGVTPGVFLDWRERAASVAEMAAIEPSSFDYVSGSEPITLNGALVTERFFDILGVEPVIGRSFLPHEHAGGSTVVLLSHAVWQRLFGGDPTVVDRTVILEGRAHTVIGILPPWMHLQRLELGTVRPLDVWAPKVLRPDERTNRRDRFWNVVAKLHAGVTLEQAQSALSAISTQLAREYPEAMTATVEPFRAHLIGGVRTSALVLGGAVGFVLLIACANVASLLLARGAHRRRELAIRSAIGASRGRIVRQLAMESTVLACAATLVGLALARWSMDAVHAFAPAYVPPLETLSLDGRVLAFSVSLATLSVLLFGLWPALFLSRPSDGSTVTGTRSETAPLGGRHRLASALVVAEVASWRARLRGVQRGGAPGLRLRGALPARRAARSVLRSGDRTPSRGRRRRVCRTRLGDAVRRGQHRDPDGDANRRPRRTPGRRADHAVRDDREPGLFPRHADPAP
jgi:predicted permease